MNLTFVFLTSSVYKPQIVDQIDKGDIDMWVDVSILEEMKYVVDCKFSETLS